MAVISDCSPSERDTPPSPGTPPVTKESPAAHRGNGACTDWAGGVSLPRHLSRGEQGSVSLPRPLSHHSWRSLSFCPRAKKAVAAHTAMHTMPRMNISGNPPAESITRLQKTAATALISEPTIEMRE